MWYLAQYSTSTTSSRGSTLGALVALIVGLGIAFVIIVALWKVFTKAGQAGWKALIPIYSTVVLLQIVGLSGWLVLLTFVPFINFLFAVYLAYRVSKAFGHGIGMTILLMLFIGYIILGLGNSKYLGPINSSTPDHQPDPTPTPQPPIPPTNPVPPLQPPVTPTPPATLPPVPPGPVAQ